MHTEKRPTHTLSIEERKPQTTIPSPREPPKVEERADTPDYSEEGLHCYITDRNIDTDDINAYCKQKWREKKSTKKLTSKPPGK